MITTTETNTGDLLQQALEKLATADPNAVDKSCKKLCLAFKAKSPWTPNLQQMELLLRFVEQQVDSVKVPGKHQEISKKSDESLQRAKFVFEIIADAQAVFMASGNGFDFGKTWKSRLNKLSKKLNKLQSHSLVANFLQGYTLVCQHNLASLTKAHQAKLGYLAGLLKLQRE